MSFWNLMLKKDDLLIKLFRKLYDFVQNFNFSRNKNVNESLKKNDFSKLESLYIILNGPSLKKQNLLNLQGENIVFVNRGYKHEHYKILQPKFHVFVDPKMLSGEWSISWVYEIIEMVPNIIFLMPAKWIKEPKIKKLIEDSKVNIIWLSHKVFSPFSCLGVSGAAIEFAIYLHIKNIYFTGFDANGLAHELINSSNSHFYGVNDENNTKTCKNYVQDLYMFSRFLNELIDLAKKAKKKGVNVINLTDGGVLDMFERKEMRHDY